MNRAVFFDAVRADPFNDRLIQPQVNGLTILLDCWERTRPDTDPRWLAYVLATAHHETAATMQPIREAGMGFGRPYGAMDRLTHQTYYGRGYVQLTWRFNYALMGARLNIDLVNKPDQALIPAYAALIICTGMVDGLFTSHALRDYFNATDDDPVRARRIINGVDQCERIAVTHRAFLAALDAARAADAPVA